MINFPHIAITHLFYLKLLKLFWAPNFIFNVLKYIEFFFKELFLDHLLDHPLRFIQLYLIYSYLFLIFLWSKG